jgi:hypothetical protein
MRRAPRSLLLCAACLLLAASCGKRRSPPPPGSLVRLAFATNLLTFNLPVGAQASREVRLAGLAATSATLAIIDVKGGATAELLPAAPGRTAGVRLTFFARQAGEGEGRVTVLTGLEPPQAPPQLVLYYSWKVEGG